MHHALQKYEEVKKETDDRLTLAVASGGHLGLVTDGWRSKTCEQGVPLINVLVTLPAGGSVFVKVRA